MIKLISGGQIRAARALLNWSGADLADKVGLSRNTIAKIEQNDSIPSIRLQTMLDLKRVFEDADIEFIGTPDNGPGVRLKPKE